MTQSFSPAQVVQVRNVPFRTILEHLGAYSKLSKDYTSPDPSRRSVRLYVGYHGRDFRLVVTDEKFVHELLPLDNPSRGGGGAIDLVKHITGLGFVQSVRVCLDAIEAKQEAGR